MYGWMSKPIIHMPLLGVGEHYDAAARIFKPVFDQIHNSIDQ